MSKPKVTLPDEHASREVERFFFDRLPAIDAAIAMDVVEAGCNAQVTDTARRNYVVEFARLFEQFRRETGR